MLLISYHVRGWREDANQRAPSSLNRLLPSSLDCSCFGVLKWWLISFSFSLSFFFFFFCLFRACGSSQAWGWIGAEAAGLHHSHRYSRLPTYWARPGIEPTSSWILVGFVSVGPHGNSPGGWFHLPSNCLGEQLCPGPLWDGCGQVFVNLLGHCLLSLLRWCSCAVPSYTQLCFSHLF